MTAEQVAEVKQLYLDGMRVRSIATRYGCTRQTIRNTLKRINVDPNRAGSMTPEEIVAAVELRKHGVSYEKIAERFAVSSTTVKKRIDEYHA